MPKVLVLFDSSTGNTAAIAGAIAEGAESLRFTEVEVRRIEDSAPAAGDVEGEDVRAAAIKYRVLESAESLALHDALVVVSPMRDGVMSAQMKQLLEQAGSPGARLELVDKVGSAFVGASRPGGDHQHSVTSLLLPLMQLGMIIVPPEMAIGDSSAGNGGAGDAQLAAARRQGARVAKVAEWVRHAKSHEAHGHKH